MTRDLDASQVTAVGQSPTRPRHFVELFFDSGTVRAWSGIGPIDFDSNGDLADETFTGVGNFGGISPIEETTEGKVNRVTLTLTGVKSSMLSIALNEQYQGRVAKIWRGWVDEDRQLIGTPKLRFMGVMDNASVKRGKGEGTISINVVSRMVRWEKPLDNPRYDNADHLSRRPNDPFFEFMPELVAGKEVVWGKR